MIKVSNEQSVQSAQSIELPPLTEPSTEPVEPPTDHAGGIGGDESACFLFTAFGFTAFFIGGIALVAVGATFLSPPAAAAAALLCFLY
jgi:hypothetical protein